MTTGSASSLTRPLSVARIPPGGLDIAVETTPAEREALAAELGLPALSALSAAFRVTGTPDTVRVAGRIRASVEQICVVSLDPFESSLDEEVSLDFESGERAGLRGVSDVELDPERDIPDEIVGGRIDLGAVVAEYLALGLDPYPRKPGVAFEPPAPADADDSPFAALANRPAAPD